MVGGGTLNLSLLSRGIGEIQQNGHEKVEVFLEPEDYFNFVKDPRRIYLPPIRTKQPFIHNASLSAREPIKLDLPKTFTTRRGALLLFSEDLAQRDNHRQKRKHGNSLSQSLDGSRSVDIKTVDDLAKSILSYGNESVDEKDEIYLGFIHNNRKKFKNERQIRPGFSAKRYLSTWTRIWDDSLLENVISKGYITERSLFYGSMAAPHLRRRIFHDDLSHYPAPYKIMRNMLISPGSLSGYTFYRMQIHEFDIVEENEEAESPTLTRQKSRPTIAVVKTKDGVQREVTYSSLDKDSQKDVLTDLLVKSAVNYALQKQQEFVENLKHPSPEIGADQEPIEAFNMKDAVESLLETEKEIREFDKATQHARDSIASINSSQSSSWPDISPSKVQLPALDRQQLSTIEDVSREGTGMKVLPPIAKGVPRLNVAPPTPKDGLTDRVTQTTPDDDENWGEGTSEDVILDRASKESEQRRLLQLQIERNKESPSSHVDGQFHFPTSQLGSDSESLGLSRNTLPISKPLHRRQWAGSTHSLKSHSSKRGAGSVIADGSIKGSVICAPGGQIIRVGGSLAQSGSQGDVANLHEVTPQKVPTTSKSSYHLTSDSETEEPEVWKNNNAVKRSASLYGYSKNIVTEQGIVNALKEHAQAIAEHILGQGGGLDLEEDIKKAANLWMQTHPPRKLSRSQSVQEYRAIDTVMKAQRINSAVPTTAEYKEMIKQSISTAVANAAGVDITALALDADISDELLEALATNSLSSDEVRLVKDPLTGRSQLTTSQNSLKDGHLYSEPNGSKSDVPPVSIPSERSSVRDIGELEVISYRTPENEVTQTVQSDKSDLRSKGSQSKRSSISSVRSTKSGTEAHIVEQDQKGNLLEKIKTEEIVQLSEEKYLVPVGENVTETSPKTIQEYMEPSVLAEDESPIESPVEVEKKDSDKGSAQSSKSSSSKTSPEKAKGKLQKLEDRDEFVVGKVKESNEIKSLYGPGEPPKRKPSLSKVVSKKSHVTATLPPPEPTTESLPVPEQKDEKATKAIEKIKEPETKPDGHGKSLPQPTKPDVKKDISIQKNNEDIPKDTKYKTKAKEELPKKTKPFIPPPGKVKEKPKPAPPVKAAEVPAAAKPEAGKPKEKKTKAPPAPQTKKEEKKKKVKKSKKTKKSEESSPMPPPPQEISEKKSPPPGPKLPAPTASPPPKSTTPRIDSGVRTDSRNFASPEEDDMEFIIIRDRSPTPEDIPVAIEKSPHKSPPKPAPESVQDKDESEDDESKLNLISSKDARAAKRAAAAAKRREEVEKKRKEREEEMKREREKAERERQRELEAEEARKRQEEQRRLRKQQEEAERLREELESREREKKRLQELEREKRMKEERQRKFEEMKRKQAEEEQKRLELLLIKQAEEAERLRLEEEKKSLMEEQERIEYERRMREEEELRKQREALEKQRREEEAARLLEEERQKAIAEARKRAELEARLKFNRSLQLESQGLSEHSHKISEAFIFSYYDILQWLGLDIPEFELQKLDQM